MSTTEEQKNIEKDQRYITCTDCHARVANNSYHPYLACYLVRSGMTLGQANAQLNEVKFHGHMDAKEAITSLEQRNRKFWKSRELRRGI